jgi:hypothetical protein
MISARAVGLLWSCVYLGTNPTAEALQARFKEGREAIRTALNELVLEGLLERRAERAGSRIMTTCFVTEKGQNYFSRYDSWAPETKDRHAESKPIPGALIQQNELTYTKYIASLTSKEITREPREEFTTMNVSDIMGYDFFDPTSSDDEATLERLKARAKHEADKKEAHQQKTRKRMGGRYDIPVVSWAPAEVGHEFAYRIENQWNIPPWSVATSRFIPALATMRKSHDTNGEIEFKMLDLFFASIDFDKYDSAEHLWKLFISRAPALVSQARGMVRTVEQVEEAQSQASKSQEWLT